ncbi:MAG TPA: hypothetical protein VFZ49_02805 [Pyrinomonadaceae bacterium]
MYRTAAAQADRSGPQWVVRRRDEDLVAGIEQGVERHHYQLRRSVAEINVIDIDAADAFLGRVSQHCLAWPDQALAIGISGCLRQVADHIRKHLAGRLEPEGGKIADVELDDLAALGFEPLCHVEHRPADVVHDTL